MLRMTYGQTEEAFRDLLKELRIKQGLSQVQLAKRLCVPQSFVSKYETGERRLDFAETDKVCSAIGVSLKAFVGLYTKRQRRKTLGHPSQQ